MKVKEYKRSKISSKQPTLKELAKIESKTFADITYKNLMRGHREFKKNLKKQLKAGPKFKDYLN